MAGASSRGTSIVAAVILISDIALVVTTIYLDKAHHVDPPAEGQVNMSAAIGWLGVISAVVIFGNFGILIKTPAVARANVDAMVFQFYYSIAVAFVSALIWAVAGSHAGLTFSGQTFAMGVLFGLLWTANAICSFNGIVILGYSVGSAIWIGTTILVSFVWGTLCFGKHVVSVPGSAAALSLLVAGVCLAAYSSHLSSQRQRRAREQPAMDVQLTSSPDFFDQENNAKPPEEGAGAGGRSAGRVLFGLLSCLSTGLTNGSLMVPMNCFQSGCPSIGISAYTGDVLAPLAFLPSLAAGVLAVYPVCFALYFWRSLASRQFPEFHFAAVSLPGLLTGLFWGMGNFNAMFATVYLGQTIGYPLTQLCLIINGLWGILYFKEVSGALPISLFVLASVIIIGGAALDGMYG
mmetsp:Transcript_30847/g.98375  ORF Transcript_30847/g.98375 Transcript_30847/m.98375 type:complete len:406 (-) Transcript_30847:112-1329(-)